MSDVLEDRLRRTFDAVAATSDEPVVTPPAPSRRPTALVAASVLVVLGLVATVLAVRRDDDPAPAADLPAWYQAIAPSLPDGFEHVAVLQSGAKHVMFQIADPTSPALLHLRVSRVPVQPDPSGTIPLGDVEAGRAPDATVRLPDGREVTVSCAIVTLRNGQATAPCTDLPRPVTADQLRTLTLAAARDLPIDALPPSDPASEGTLGRFPYAAAVRTVADLVAVADLSRPRWGFDQYAQETDGDAVLQVRYVRGLVPAVSSSRAFAEADGATITWQVTDGSLVMVISRSPLAPGTGTEVLDAIEAMPASTGPTWAELLLPALPDGFEHIAIVESGEEVVQFQAFDLTTGRSLTLSISRDPVPGGERVSLDDARWNDASVLVSLPDGRQVGVTCSVLDTSTLTTCPTLGEVAVPGDERRTLAMALADIPVDALPEIDGIPVGIDMLAVAGRATVGLDMPQISGGSQQRWVSSLTFGTNVGDRPDLVIRAAHSVTPAPDVAVRSVELDDRTMTWRGMPDGSVWVVSATSAVDAAVPAAILQGVLDELTDGSLPQLPDVPTTVPPD